MNIEWDSYRQRYVVTEDGVEIGHFPRASEAEAWVLAEHERRDALPRDCDPGMLGQS